VIDPSTSETRTVSDCLFLVTLPAPRSGFAGFRVPLEAIVGDAVGSALVPALQSYRDVEEFLVDRVSALITCSFIAVGVWRPLATP
jgi:hypothetical protein